MRTISDNRVVIQKWVSDRTAMGAEPDSVADTLVSTVEKGFLTVDWAYRLWPSGLQRDYDAHVLGVKCLSLEDLSAFSFRLAETTSIEGDTLKLHVWTLREEPDCTVCESRPLTALGDVPNVDATVLEEAGFVGVDTWAIGRTVQPAVIWLDNLVNTSTGELERRLVATEPVIWVVPKSALPTLKYKPAVGGGVQWTGVFTPVALTEECVEHLQAFWDGDKPDVRVAMVYFGGLDVDEHYESESANEFIAWMSTLAHLETC